MGLSLPLVRERRRVSDARGMYVRAGALPLCVVVRAIPRKSSAPTSVVMKTVGSSVAPWRKVRVREGAGWVGACERLPGNSTMVVSNAMDKNQQERAQPTQCYNEPSLPPWLQVVKRIRAMPARGPTFPPSVPAAGDIFLVRYKSDSTSCDTGRVTTLPTLLLLTPIQLEASRYQTLSFF